MPLNFLNVPPMAQHAVNVLKKVCIIEKYLSDRHFCAGSMHPVVMVRIDGHGPSYDRQSLHVIQLLRSDTDDVLSGVREGNFHDVTPRRQPLLVVVKPIVIYLHLRVQIL